MKLRFIALLFILCATTLSKPVSAQCSVFGSVSLTSSNFPDKNLRKLVKRKFDKNKDNILSPEEIKKATKLTVNKPINLRGLSLLKNLRTLELYDEVENYPYLNNLKNLKNLYIGGSCRKKIVLNLSGLKNLNYVAINNDTVKDIKLPPNIKETYINSSIIKKLDLRKYKKLETIELDSTTKLETLDVRNCKKLKNIWATATMPSLEKVRLKNMKGLKKMLFGSTPKLKNINLGETPRLEEFKIHSSVTKFDLNLATKLQTVKISDLKTKTLDISKLSELFYFYCCDSNVEKFIWGKKKKLYHIVLNNNKLNGTLNLENLPGLNAVECSYNNLDYIYAGHHKNLKSISCYNNNLKKLDLSFLDTSDLYFSCQNNPNVVIYLKNKDPQKNYINNIDRSATIIYRNKQ